MKETLSFLFTDADFSMCNIIRGKQNGGPNIVLKDNNEIIGAIMSKQFGETNMGPCCKLFKKEIIGNLRFNEKIFFGEDTLFSVEYAKRSTCGVYVRQGLYHYDIPTSSMTYRTDGKMLNRYLTYIDSRLGMLKNTEMLSMSAKNIIVNSLFESILQSYFVARKAHAIKVEMQLCRMMKDMLERYVVSFRKQDKLGCIFMGNSMAY